MKMKLLSFAIVTNYAVNACTQGPGFKFDLPLKIQQETSNLSAKENVFLTTPDPLRSKNHLKQYTDVPHMAGTPGDLKMAKYTRDTMRDLGFESEIVPVDTLLSSPNDRSLELLGENGEVKFKAGLTEDILDFDSTSDTPWRNKTFNGYSPSGCATGNLVYANYGRPQDFDELEKLGVSVEGKVVITRYGQCFRGLKAMNAQERGAAAVLIYSDPFDDGYAKGEVYPNGPWRPESSVQRGSIQFNSLCAGDPARAASDKSTEEICGYSQEELYPKIPVIPISYGDAKPFLEALKGPDAPKSFVGALNIKYRVGPSTDKVKVFTDNSFFVAPIWNVVTKIPGTLSAEEDRPVMLGNHRDAWVFGAADPNSGSTCLLEVAKGFSTLMKESNWQPKHTIYMLSWSGEEYGLLGSTAWGEENEELLKNAMVYLNVDVGVSGKKLRVSATPSLGRVIEEVLKHVHDPDSGKPMIDHWDRKISTLGSGSDYTVFLDHLGIASVDMSFEPLEYNSYGTYHSTYDSFDYVTKTVDPTMEYHTTMAKVWGLIAIKMADADVIPFNLADQAKSIVQYVETIEHMAKESTLQGKINFDALQQAAREFETVANDFHVKLNEATGKKNNLTAGLRAVRSLDTVSMKEFNDKLAFTERQFLNPKGLHKRSWFKHVLQSPGLYLGYDADVLPGVAQAIRDGDLAVATDEISKVVAQIRQAASFLKN